MTAKEALKAWILLAGVYHQNGSEEARKKTDMARDKYFELMGIGDSTLFSSIQLTQV